MATQILLPKIGFSVTEGHLVEWMFPDGARVTEGAILFVFESEKATQEIESPASGTLRIRAQVGETYPVGTVLGIIE